MSSQLKAPPKAVNLPPPPPPPTPPALLEVKEAQIMPIPPEASSLYHKQQLAVKPLAEAFLAAHPTLFGASIYQPPLSSFLDSYSALIAVANTVEAEAALGPPYERESSFFASIERSFPADQPGEASYNATITDNSGGRSILRLNEKKGLSLAPIPRRNTHEVEASVTTSLGSTGRQPMAGLPGSLDEYSNAASGGGFQAVAGVYEHAAMHKLRGKHTAAAAHGDSAPSEVECVFHIPPVSRLVSAISLQHLQSILKSGESRLSSSLSPDSVGLLELANATTEQDGGGSDRTGIPTDAKYATQAPPNPDLKSSQLNQTAAPTTPSENLLITPTSAFLPSLPAIVAPHTPHSSHRKGHTHTPPDVLRYLQTAYHQILYAGKLEVADLGGVLGLTGLLLTEQAKAKRHEIRLAKAAAFPSDRIAGHAPVPVLRFFYDDRPFLCQRCGCRLKTAAARAAHVDLHDEVELRLAKRKEQQDAGGTIAKSLTSQSNLGASSLKLKSALYREVWRSQKSWCVDSTLSYHPVGSGGDLVRLRSLGIWPYVRTGYSEYVHLLKTSMKSFLKIDSAFWGVYSGNLIVGEDEKEFLCAFPPWFPSSAMKALSYEDGYSGSGKQNLSEDLMVGGGVDIDEGIDENEGGFRDDLGEGEENEDENDDENDEYGVEGGYNEMEESWEGGVNIDGLYQREAGRGSFAGGLEHSLVGKGAGGLMPAFWSLVLLGKSSSLREGGRRGGNFGGKLKLEVAAAGEGGGAISSNALGDNSQAPRSEPEADLSRSFAHNRLLTHTYHALQMVSLQTQPEALLLQWRLSKRYDSLCEAYKELYLANRQAYPALGRYHKSKKGKRLNRKLVFSHTSPVPIRRRLVSTSKFVHSEDEINGNLQRELEGLNSYKESVLGMKEGATPSLSTAYSSSMPACRNCSLSFMYFCALCMEPVPCVWNEELNEWVYRDAVLVERAYNLLRLGEKKGRLVDGGSDGKAVGGKQNGSGCGSGGGVLGGYRDDLNGWSASKGWGAEPHERDGIFTLEGDLGGENGGDGSGDVTDGGGVTGAAGDTVAAGAITDTAAAAASVCVSSRELLPQEPGRPPVVAVQEVYELCVAQKPLNSSYFGVLPSSYYQGFSLPHPESKRSKRTRLSSKKVGETTCSSYDSGFPTDIFWSLEASKESPSKPVYPAPPLWNAEPQDAGNMRGMEGRGGCAVNSVVSGLPPLHEQRSYSALLNIVAAEFQRVNESTSPSSASCDDSAAPFSGISHATELNGGMYVHPPRNEFDSSSSLQSSKEDSCLLSDKAETLSYTKNASKGSGHVDGGTAATAYPTLHKTVSHTFTGLTHNSTRLNDERDSPVGQNALESPFTSSHIANSNFDSFPLHGSSEGFYPLYSSRGNDMMSKVEVWRSTHTHLSDLWNADSQEELSCFPAYVSGLSTQYVSLPRLCVVHCVCWKAYNFAHRTSSSDTDSCKLGKEVYSSSAIAAKRVETHNVGEVCVRDEFVGDTGKARIRNCEDDLEELRLAANGKSRKARRRF